MTVLLVDDELQLRNYLRTLVDWAGHGYTLLEAENGEAAIGIMQKTPVHLLMLDIAMPGMTGFEVLEWVRENCYPCVTAMLTSREEIRYAQRALRLGCNDYVIKSDITAEGILALAGRMQQKLSLEAQQQQRRDAMEVAVRRQELVEMRDTVSFWLRNNQQSKLDIARFFEEKLGFCDGESRYILLRIAIHDYANVVGRYTDSDIVEFSVVFDGVLCELLEGHDFFYTECEAGEFYVFLHFGLRDAVHELLGRAQRLARRIDGSFTGLLGIRSQIAYTLPYIGVANSVARCAQMSELKARAFWNPPSEILCLEDFVFDEVTCAGELAAFETALAQELISRSILRIDARYNDMVSKIVERHYGIHPTAFMNVCEAAVAMFLRAQNREASRFQPPLPADCDAFKAQLLAQIEPLCISEGDQGKTLLIKKAVLLIQQHYQEDIGLEWLATRLFVNASYLSRVFSAETGQPVTSYINTHRIEQAKRLISTANLKLYEVAQRVGFSSSVVFSSTFKKVAGETPTDYKNRSV